MSLKNIKSWGLLSILITLYLTACTTLPELKDSIKKDQGVVPDIEPPLKSKKDYLTYTFDSSEDSTQAQAAIYGTFILKEGCFILDHGNGLYSTPVFPDSVTKWDKKNHIITINGISFGLGDSIYTNGGYLLYGPDANTQLEEEIDKRCLMPSISYIGTYDLKKRNST
ncbi:hypothetical protein [Psychrobacter celer]|uniref:hypothetical protein n=1 Tax=Psychrobacter celer TaxID=306572 RepID=UPI003FD3480E